MLHVTWFLVLITYYLLLQQPRRCSLCCLYVTAWCQVSLLESGVVLIWLEGEGGTSTRAPPRRRPRFSHI
jgi:hypothetical protein